MAHSPASLRAVAGPNAGARGTPIVPRAPSDSEPTDIERASAANLRAVASGPRHARRDLDRVVGNGRPAAAGERRRVGVLEVVARLAVLRDVQPVVLVALADSQARDEVNDLEQHERSDRRNGPGDNGRNELVDELSAARLVLPIDERVDRAGGEGTGQE